VHADADDLDSVSADRLPTKGGPVPDRISIWPLDDGRYGSTPRYRVPQATSAPSTMDHVAERPRVGVRHSFRQELDGGWTLRFGPLRAVDVAAAMSALVY
jgi:hypothetical protein